MLDFLTEIENGLMRVDLFGWLDFAAGVQKHGRMRRFEWRDQNGYAVEALLRRYGIHPRGWGVHVEVQRDEQGRRWKSYRKWMFINHKQAAWAEYILLRAGVRLEGPLIDGRNRQWAERHAGAPRAWRDQRRRKTAMERVTDWFGRVIGADEFLRGNGRR